MSQSKTPSHKTVEEILMFVVLGDGAIRLSPSTKKRANKAISALNTYYRELALSCKPEEKDIHEKGINIHLDNQYVGFNQALSKFEDNIKRKFGGE